jgi:TIR domain
MKVFISWSGGRSRCIADVLRRWLPSVLQAVRPYFSPDDVAKGARWSAEIAKELEASRIGLLIITPENQEASWLLFEAGALAKNLERSKVCPLLFGAMEPTDVKGPLVQFQAAQFSKDEMKRVVKMINAELAESLSADVLDGVFEMWWPKLEGQVKDELEKAQEGEDKARRSERDILEEVLALSRRLSSDRERRLDTDHPAFEDLIVSAAKLIRLLRLRPVDEETRLAMKAVLRPMEFYVRSGPRHGFRTTRMARHMMMEFEDLFIAEPSKTSAETSAQT